MMHNMNSEWSNRENIYGHRWLTNFELGLNTILKFEISLIQTYNTL
jgi:hypothetical protein